MAFESFGGNEQEAQYQSGLVQPEGEIRAAENEIMQKVYDTVGRDQYEELLALVHATPSHSPDKVVEMYYAQVGKTEEGTSEGDAFDAMGGVAKALREALGVQLN